MKVIQVNITDKQGGGAARCAWSLFKRLESKGVDSGMFVMAKRSNEPNVGGPEGLFQRLYYRFLVAMNYIGILLFYRGHRGGHTLGLFPNPFLRKLKVLKPDIVHLHAPACSFIPIHSLENLGCPVVWSFHDLWAMVGGAHHPTQVPACFFEKPVESRCQKRTPRWIDQLIWNRKQKHWKHANLSVITPSRWMGDWAHASKIFEKHRVEVIPNAVDLDFFCPAAVPGSALDRDLKEGLSLEIEAGAFVILFGANSLVTDTNKGLSLVVDALTSLDTTVTRSGRPVQLVLFGADADVDTTQFPMPVSVIGPVQSYEQMRLLYQRADVFLMASVFENLPFVVMEAFGCETPVIAVNTGGIPEMIEHQLNGYLLEERTSSALKKAIEWALSHENWDEVKRASRAYAETHYSMTEFVDKHLELYKDLIAEL